MWTDQANALKRLLGCLDSWSPSHNVSSLRCKTQKLRHLCQSSPAKMSKIYEKNILNKIHQDPWSNLGPKIFYLLRLRPQRNNYTILLDSGLLTVPRLSNCLHKDIQGLTKQHQYHLTSWQKMTNQFTIQASLLSCTFGAKPPSSPTLQALSERAPASKLHAMEIQKQYISTSIIRFLSYMILHAIFIMHSMEHPGRTSSW